MYTDFMYNIFIGIWYLHKFSNLGLYLRMEEKKRRVNIEDIFKQINAVNRKIMSKQWSSKKN